VCMSFPSPVLGHRKRPSSNMRRGEVAAGRATAVVGSAR